MKGNLKAVDNFTQKIDSSFTAQDQLNPDGKLQSGG